MSMSPDEVVRRFFDCYTEGRPQGFDEVVAPDYMDYGHTPPGRGPDGARDDYANAVKLAGGLVRYTIDALVVDDEMVAAAWTGVLPNGKDMRGLSLYRTSGGLLRSTRHALIGELPL
jgi:SnoaL-like domain